MHMTPLHNLAQNITSPHKRFIQKNLLLRLHIDAPLLLGLLSLAALGLVILYSASGQSMALLGKQVMRFGLAFFAMFIVAQIPPSKLRLWAPWLFFGGLSLLIMVLVMGHIGKGAQRWLDLGFFRFQPSEIMKLAIPLFMASLLYDKPMPISNRALFFCTVLVAIPIVLTAKQPDLGTAIMLLCSASCVLLFAGLRLKVILFLSGIAALCTPFLWHHMHNYQRQRVLTFLNPERDPLGSGYHIIQSKIAIGSGGLFGKGWLEGTQSHLHFLPEHATDFIFAVVGEEFGLVGGIILLTMYILITARGLYISTQAQDSFSRLVAGSISLSFFFYMFVNMGMVMGILPVVGIPLPLVSYGGTSVVSLMIGFGILMSIHTHRKLLAR